MQIKRIEIVGFKSFVDRVTLDLSEGISAVVGPNGCGKSNIVDAIRWVMGEQSAKNLRGTAMEDIIFGGSESRKPLGMAEVSMIFSNEKGLGPPGIRDYPEIMITRRLYRNGDSDYLLNKTPCRLLDITELFMDTGVGARAYSIIEQGKIGTILNAKPEERRFLIEEAAGISKFKSRKKAAMRKIEATQQNLLRIRDVVSEVRRQLNALNRQARKAERYREYREEYKGIEVRFAIQRLHELQSQIDSEANSSREQDRQREELEVHLAQQELQLEEGRLLQAADEKELQKGQERVFHLAGELQKVETRIEFSEKEQTGLERQKAQLAAEAEELGRRLTETAREEQDLLDAESALVCDREEASRKLAEDEMALEEMVDVEQSSLSLLEKSRQDLFAVAGAVSRMDSRGEEIQRRCADLEDRIRRNRQESIQAREKHAECQLQLAEQEDILAKSRTRHRTLSQDTEILQEEIRLLRRQLENNENLLLEQQETLSRRRSRLESLQALERNLEGYGGGVRMLLEETSWRECSLGMLADLLEVPACHELAVEMVLGDRLQTLLVNSSGDAWDGLDLLRSKGGRSAFLVPSANSETLPSIPGGQPLVDLVSFQPGSEAQVAAMLKGIFLVADLKPYVENGIPFGVTVVTPDGESFSHSGVLQGGDAELNGEGLLQKRREIKELSLETRELDEAVVEMRRQRQQLKQAFGEAEETLHSIKGSLHAEELRLADGEKDLTRIHENAHRLLDRVDILNFEEEQLQEEQGALHREADEVTRNRAGQAAILQEQEQVVARLQAEVEQQRKAMEEIREQVTVSKVALAGIKEREDGSRNNLQRLRRFQKESRERLLRLNERQEEFEEKKKQLEESIERGRTEMEILYHRREEEKTRFEGLKEQFDEKFRLIESMEEQLKILRRDLSVVREALSSRQVKLRELEMERDHLRQSLMERYRIDLLEVQADEEPFDAQAAERRLAELRDQLDAMGEVNLTAIEEYRQLDERWQFLTIQEKDLLVSLEGLQSAISKINRTTRKRFRETFEEVNARFQEVFPRLFLGGKAELALTDEQDLLETGIEIVVQPPGKKLQNVMLLSGGEKALTAVALIFAIFLIKPSPFCLLDEVDAPLDDANINRFNEMVREMSAKSQFIIVTHNKRTMGIADTLYGVTMEEPGVSKLVSVRIDEF